MLRFVVALVLAVAPATAQDLDSVITAEVRPGWRMGDTHVAALHLTLAPGWKTYWRSPGDAGIPPLFDWDGGVPVRVHWPAPVVFHQSGMRSVGYADEVVLPLSVAVAPGADVTLSGTVDLGLCDDICLPHRVRVSARLPADATQPDPVIAAALASRPFSAAEAGLGAVRCDVWLREGEVQLRADIPLGGRGPVETVIETADPEVWVADPDSRWVDGGLVAETRLRHVDGGAFALDRSGVRITVLQPGQAIDIRGCTR